ncbi:MAG TPA: hypothetical protein VNY05_39785 [Candidatus Acidoferrales bacterium]|nr:hypothetical protein [Candidatus Acidoferrales bacterium]
MSSLRPLRLGETICFCLAFLLALPSLGMAQTPAGSRLVVHTVSNSIKVNIGSKAPEPSVRVQDENGRPVADATVTFTIISPDAAGPGATFAGGARSLRVTTDAAGDAVAFGLRPNQVQGRYLIEIQAQKPLMLSAETPVSVAAENAMEIKRLVIAPGDAFINNLCKKTSGEPKVQVQDEQGKPVIGADVTFRLPATGAGGVFTGGSATRLANTDDSGQAMVKGFVPNKTTGVFAVEAVASILNLRANAVVSGSNVRQSCFPTLLVVIGTGALAAAAGLAVGKKGSSSSSAPAPTPANPSTIGIGSGGDPRFGGH